MAKSKEELIYDIENELVDSNTGKITGERVKARLLDMVDAMGTGGGAMEYWKAADPAVPLKLIAVYASLAKGIVDGEVMIAPGAMLADFAEGISAIAFDRNARMYVQSEFLTYDEILAMLGLTTSLLTQITEEEFYTIE